MSADLLSGQVLSEIRNHLGIITLNRPAALNALTLEMLVDLRTLLSEFARDNSVRAVMIKGAGEKAFCAGGDIRALYQDAKNAGSLHREFFATEYAVDFSLHRYPKPYVALMDGITMGGGMGISQGSTLRIVGERTRLAMPEVGIGLFPDVGASYFLPKLPGFLGFYLALTGVQIRWADALYARLADLYLPPSAITALAEEFDTLTWSGDPAGDIEAFLKLRSRQPPQEPRVPEPLALERLRPAIDLHFGQPSVDAILLSLDEERRSVYVDWARDTAKLMRGRSPTMISVTLSQLHRGSGLTLAACFRMELAMAEQCFVQGDFLEGVRALIIDKDNAPRWLPSQLADVTDASVQAFFQERWSPQTHPLSDLETTFH